MTTQTKPMSYREWLFHPDTDMDYTPDDIRASCYASYVAEWWQSKVEGVMNGHAVAYLLEEIASLKARIDGLESRNDD